MLEQYYTSILLLGKIKWIYLFKYKKIWQILAEKRNWTFIFPSWMESFTFKLFQHRVIINKTDLQDVFLPMMIHHGIYFLTDTRRSQFNLAMYILEKDIKQFLLIPNSLSGGAPTPVFSELPENSLDYLNLKFFKNWVVGFTNAEGSFLVKSNQDACFQIKQRTHINLFEAIKLLFLSNRKLTVEGDKYLQFSVSSKKDIQTVINFFSFSGLHPLTGLKNIKYFNWLNELKSSYRYNSLNFPQ